ncbi:tetratricopeptide repeat protein [Brumimicrobium mesophilum]|uniref:tetratricopeptide repeat protein n=1 Tax=Brumimicrobium mesophilum TaxID=392717 RepID=UPI000D143573|nr:tetratricopeptide repeat protein [Brumimicrobium mesophilum]
MIKLFLNIAFVFSLSIVLSQNTDEQLANYYFNEGDCEKAIPYFEKIYSNNPNEFIYKRYLSCLKESEQDKEVIQLIEKQISYHPHIHSYQVELGDEYEIQGNLKKAEKTYQDLINNLNANPRVIIDLQKAFSNLGKNDLALQTLEKGNQVLNGNYPLNIQFAEVYGALNETEKMIQQYIDLLDYNPGMISSLKILIPRMIDFDDENNERFKMFQNELIRKIQKNPNDAIYSELLVWAFVQKRNFPAALVQSKALDKRTANDGREVFKIGNQASQNNDFSTARAAFKYIIDLGIDKPYYYAAEQLLLNTRYMEITTLRNYSSQEVSETIQEYQTTLERMPENGKALPIIRELAFIQAYYGEQPDSAILTLEKALELPKYNDVEEAKIKLLMADVMVLINNVWDASLLYMQVEKQFKFEPIGQEAKFKNARIFYYDGDFIFAQSQLDVLKEATTRLIANDAMNLSILITDNLGLDSNYVAMSQFAKADLLLEQHKYDEAFKMYDSITDIFPDHNLKDEILMRKSQAFRFKGEWNTAITLLQEIVEKHGDDILADDALYQIAQIYENHIFDNKKAAEFYFQLMRDYPGSLFVTEARKAYRKIN